MGKSTAIISLCCGLLLAMTARAIIPTKDVAPRLAAPVAAGQTNDLFQQFGAETMKWLPDWDGAQRLAARDNRSLLVFFFSPLCGWCQRMDQEVLASPEVRERLSALVLMRINILEDEKTAARFRVRATPTLLLLSPEGRESWRLEGFVDKAALLQALDELLANRRQAQDERIQSMIQQLREQKLPGQNWAELMMAMGNDRHREKIKETVIALRPLPRQDLVRLLEHPLLTVRLGAMEVLEELTGDDFGYNPWLDQPPQEKDALQKWMAWGAATNLANADETRLYRVLSPEDTANYLLDLVSEDLERSTRARYMLVKGGPASLEGISAFLVSHADLPTGSVNKLRELRYTLLLPPIRGFDSASLAHRLIFGNLNVRLNALRDAATARQRAVPVIEEFLGDPEPLVRETAVDALVTAGGRKIVSILEKHLKTEADANVNYTVLRQLGNLRSKKGLDILLQYVDHTNEDLVIVALESIGKLRSDTAAPQIGKCLDDPRWRVRVAALKAAEVLALQSLSAKVTAMLEDKDDFVRSAAVDALAMLGAKEALPKLEALFGQDDNLKGAIVNALSAADLPMPESFVKVLAGTAPSVLLNVVDHLETADLKMAPMLTTFAAHPDADLACASLQLIARTGMEHTPYQKAVAQQIQAGDRRRLLAIMNSLEVPMQTLARYNPAVRPSDFDKSTAAPPAGSTATNHAADDVFAAFESPSVPSSGAKKKDGLVDDIFAAFEGGKAVSSESSVQTLLRIGKQILQGSGDGELKSAAARMLVHLGEVAGVAQSLIDLPQLAVDQRGALAQSVGRVRNRDGLPLIQRLLADPAPEVRQAACLAVMGQGASESCLMLLVSELQRQGALLKANEVYPALQSGSSQRTLKPAMTRAAHDLLRSSDEALRTLALILMAKAWSPESEKLIEPFLASPSPWQRRAAFNALGLNSRARFIQEADRMAADSSEYVREVVPYQCMAESANYSWMQYFDEQKQELDYNGLYGVSSRREPIPLKDEILTALRKLAKDPSERVRFNALFCLITREQPVDLSEVVRLLEKMPRDSELLQHFSTYLFQTHATMGKEFAVVLPYLDFRLTYEEGKTKQIYEHFGVNEDEPLPRAALLAGKTLPPVIASYVPAPVAVVAPSSPANYQVVYFTKPGCKECAAVTRKLEQLKEPFPHLVVLEYDINKTASVLLNEALSKRFGVPASVRLVAPSVFSGGGYLIKDDITLDRLGQMLVRATSVPLTNWLAVPQQDLAVAHQDVVQRYQTTGLALVMIAGLLDGINPCAFATIIFLLSYLQVSRKSPRDILQIGFAYIGGVLLAYFLIGLGLAKVTAMVARLSWAGTLLTYSMAGFALVIMALSIRDGIRCWHGQLGEMTLQLPDAFKNRIHQMIRHGVRQAHFVLVAFFLGMTISFLELACTGQVYLPTITYMIQQGEGRAVLNLLAYNLAFILPLAIVFALSYSGLRSETLLALLKRRAACVKLSTALLFLMLALFLLFGRRLFT